MENKMRLIDANRYLRETKFQHGIYPHQEIFAEINRQPTVDAVEVVHGQWLDGYAVDRNGKKVYDSIDCSRCNDIFKIETEDREYWKNRFKVCPFCGAVMDGGNEDG